MQISKLGTLSNMKHLKARTVFWVMSTLWPLSCYLSRLAEHSKFKINQVVSENEWKSSSLQFCPKRLELLLWKRRLTLSLKAQFCHFNCESCQPCSTGLPSAWENGAGAWIHSQPGLHHWDPVLKHQGLGSRSEVVCLLSMCKSWPRPSPRRVKFKTPKQFKKS